MDRVFGSMEDPPAARARPVETRSRSKRVVTEARREQNRVAQRAYRQRQREERLRNSQSKKTPRYRVLQPLPAAQNPPTPDPIPTISPESSDPSQIDLINDVAPEQTSRRDNTNHVEAGDNPLNVGGVDPFFAVGWVSGPANSSTRQVLISEWTVAPNRMTEDDAWDGETQPALADLYLNRLQFSKASFLQACVFNARCLGIGPEEFSGYSCLSFCSPFYRPVTMSDDPKTLLAAVSRPSIPPHLQPTLPQVLFPHHPILDLIPLPGLRARAIMLAATTPLLLDAFDLKKDVVEGGLTCWAAERGGNSQPWDKRSWEAAPWFLRKWRLLVDGPESDLWQQSVWWQGMQAGEGE